MSKTNSKTNAAAIDNSNVEQPKVSAKQRRAAALKIQPVIETKQEETMQTNSVNVFARIVTAADVAAYNVVASYYNANRLGRALAHVEAALNGNPMMTIEKQFVGSMVVDESTGEMVDLRQAFVRTIKGDLYKVFSPKSTWNHPIISCLEQRGREIHSAYANGIEFEWSADANTLMKAISYSQKVLKAGNATIAIPDMKLLTKHAFYWLLMGEGRVGAVRFVNNAGKPVDINTPTFDAIEREGKKATLIEVVMAAYEQEKALIVSGEYAAQKEVVAPAPF